MQALEAEVGSLAPEVHAEVPGWARLEKHPGGRKDAGQARPGWAGPPTLDLSSPYTDSALSGSGNSAGLKISGLSEAGVAVGRFGVAR